MYRICKIINDKKCILSYNLYKPTQFDTLDSKFIWLEDSDTLDLCHQVSEYSIFRIRRIMKEHNGDYIEYADKDSICLLWKKVD